MFDGRSSAFEIAREAVRWGVGGLELMNFCDELQEPDMKAAKEIGKFARGAGLALPCFSVGIHLCSECNHAQIERLKAYVDICSELEIPYLHHTLDTSLDPSVLDSPLDTIMRVATEAAVEVSEYAASKGVRTIVEDMGFLVNGIENYTRFRNGTGGAIGVLLDVGNIMFVDETSEDFCARFVHEIDHVHIKDYHLTDTPIAPTSYRTKKGMYLTDAPIGLGDINIGRTISILEEGGYRGHYSLEFSGSQTDGEIERVLSYLCDFLGSF
jgi:sugar phosphate isomerase/epimerase